MKIFAVKNESGRLINGRTARGAARKAALFLLAVVFWASLWYIAAAVVGNRFILPYPHRVVQKFFMLLTRGYFWSSVGMSVLAVAAGFFAGAVAGILFSLLSFRFVVARAVISPMVTVLRATPVASFIILVYVMIRWNDLPVNLVSVIIVVIMVMPIVYNNLLTGYSSFDKQLDEVAVIYDFSLGKKIAALWFPQIKPYAAAAATTSLGLAWKAGIAAEVICGLSNTIGKYLADAKTNLEMEELFAWTICVVLLSVLFEWLFKRLLKSTANGGGKS